jgi:hypothetical protein
LDLGAEMAERQSTYTKTRTLKNGEIKQYTYVETYTTKTNIKRNMGKEIARKRLVNCNDKDKIDMVYKYMCEIGM